MSDHPIDTRSATAVTLDELLDRCRGLIASGERRILGIAGTPGAGKSTLCAALIAGLGGQAVLVGQDGFHFANQELERLGRRDRKGAPDTFDVGGFVALLGRLGGSGVGGRGGSGGSGGPGGSDGPDASGGPGGSDGLGGGTVYAPVFDRALEESIGSAVPVPASVPLVITEGNYLLADDHGWSAVREHLHESWFVDVSPELRRDRLIRRRVSYGHSPADSADWVREVDEKNAAVVDATRGNADLLLHLTTVL
ncbi:nucleoside/nucleotide kinase family protein [Herbiconiux sp. P16]|uniref:nucleoside/nucleotide kinase family protein n=1 Tax=Herbiconiux wuyangfengii TaxID=3342794 RepID=UPI0035B6EC8B